MLDTINNLIQTFIKFFPHLLLVRKTESGVLFKRGKHVRIVEPGIYWYWPMWTETIVYPTVRQIINLPSKLMMTSDGKPIYVSGVVVYNIDDINAFFVENYNAEESISEVSTASLRDVLVTQTLEDISGADRENIDEEITEKITEELGIFGVEVEYFRITDLATVNPVVLVSTGSHTHNYE